MFAAVRWLHWVCDRLHAVPQFEGPTSRGNYIDVRRAGCNVLHLFDLTAACGFVGVIINNDLKILLKHHAASGVTVDLSIALSLIWRLRKVQTPYDHTRR
jgi:hypothetical protein